MKRPEGRIYFDTFQQKKDVERAAKRRNWSLSRFMIEASLAVMAKDSTASKPNPVMVETNQESLNQ